MFQMDNHSLCALSIRFMIDECFIEMDNCTFFIISNRFTKPHFFSYLTRGDLLKKIFNGIILCILF